jgi:predicted secreted protein
MRRDSISAVVLTLALALPLASMADQPSPDQTLKIKTDFSGKTKISFNQVAKKTLARNRLRIDLRIEAQGDSSKDIQGQINRKMPAVLEITKAAPDLWVETGSYRVFREPESNSHPERWHSTQDISIFSDDFAEALAVAGKCQAQGLLMTNMTFFLAPDDLQATQSDLTKTALDALRARADEVAADLGMKIDHYQNISIGNAFESNEVSRGAQTGALAAAGTPAAQAGQTTVSLSVSADVLLSGAH